MFFLGKNSGVCVIMSMIDLLIWVNVIIKKYEKYDVDKLKEGLVIVSYDYFLKFYKIFEDDVNDVLKVIFIVSDWKVFLNYGF